MKKSAFRIIFTILLVFTLVVSFNSRLFTVEAALITEIEPKILSPAVTERVLGEVLESNFPQVSSTIDSSQINSDSNKLKVKRHKIKSDELEKLKKQIGVAEKTTDYNEIINGYGTGLRPPNEKEWMEIGNSAYIIDKAISASLPSIIDHSTTHWFPPIGNQDGEGSCVAWAVGYYVKTFQEAKENDWDLSGAEWEGGYYGAPTQSYQNRIISPDFIYHLINDGVDEGSYYSQAINLVSSIGTSSWEKMPYDPNDHTTWPSDEAWTEAMLYRAADSGYQFMYVDTDSGLSNLKNWLASENLAIISIDAAQYVYLTGSDFWTLDTYVNPSTNHANTIVGFDDNIMYNEDGQLRQGAFKVANSWGIGGWENVDDGFYWISYEAMKERIEYCMIYDDRIGYEPELSAVFRIDHEKRGEVQIAVGMGTPSSPIITKSFSQYISGGDLPFCLNDIIFDITEFKDYTSTINGKPFFLQVYDGSSTTVGTILKFSIDYSDSLDVPVQTVNNDVVYLTLTIPATRDLEVSLESPVYLRPGEATALNVTVQNLGLYSEFDVEVFLMINGTIVENEIVSELGKDESYTIRHAWHPTIEGVYNVTAYVPPVSGEDITNNNMKSTYMIVHELTDTVIIDDNDGGYSFDGTSLPEFESALGKIDYDYFVWNQSLLGNPSLDFLSNFKLIIWTCGDYFGGAVDPVDALTLEAYLRQGGNLLLEGEDIGYDHQDDINDQFMVNVAHALYEVDNTGASGLTVTNPFHQVSNGLPSVFSWSIDPPFDDGVNPVNNGIEVIRYNDTNWSAVTVFEGTASKVAYYAFPLYCLDIDEQETLAMNTINWLLEPPQELRWIEDIAACDEPFPINERKPVIATDSNGYLYIAYEYQNSETGLIKIYVSKSTDNGVTWSTIGYVSDVYDLSNPSIAIDTGDDNNIFVAFEREYTTTDHDIFVLRYVDGSWTVSTVANSIGNDHRYPSITSEYQYGVADRQYISYEYVYSHDDRDLMFAQSEDDGATWSTRKLHGDWPDGNVYCQTSITTTRGSDGNDYIYIAYKWGVDYDAAYDIVIDKSTNRGTTWTQQWICDESSRDKNLPSIAATHGGGTVVVAWHVYLGSTFLNDIQYVRSTDNGDFWFGGFIVWSGSDEKTPTLTVDGQGSTSIYEYGYIHVTYWRENAIYYSQAPYDSPWDWTSPEEVSDIYTITSTTYTKPAITTYRSEGGSYLPAIVWTDIRNGNYDIYYSTKSANESIPMYSLSVNVVGNGIVDLNASGPYDPGTAVELTAVPDAGWEFTGWSGDLSGSDTPVILLMDSNKTVTATFSLLEKVESYLVVRGLDDGIYYRIYNSSEETWGSWIALAGSTCDSPASVVYDNKLYLVVRGMDGASLWFGSVDLSDDSFSGWIGLSGAIPSKPSLVCWESGERLVLVVRGTDDRIYHRQYDLVTESWGSWNAVPTGTTVDSPAATVDGDYLHLVVRGMDDDLYHQRIYLPTLDYLGWSGIGGTTPSAPTLTCNYKDNGDDHLLYLIVRGSNDGIYLRSYDGSWSSWTSLSGSTNDAVGACIQPSKPEPDAALQIVVRGMTGGLYHGEYDLNSESFLGWSWISGETPSPPTLTS